MLTKNQASAALDQLIVDAQRRSDERKLRRLQSRAGPRPPGLTLAEFDTAVEKAESTLFRSGMLWTVVAALLLIMIALIRFRAIGVLPALVPVSMLLLHFVRRRLVAAQLRRDRTGR